MAARFPRQVVIDTQVFKAQNFNFEAKPFKLLKALQEEGRVSIYITDIVRSEVLFRMRREVEESASWYNELRRKAKILFSAQHTPFCGLPGRLDVTGTVRSLGDSFDAFLRSAAVEVIDSSEVPMKPVLDGYFSVAAPFGSGEKRREFPDAISLQAVMQKFGRDGAFVISKDGGIAEACSSLEGLFHLNTIEDFLGKELEDHEDTSWIVQALNQHGEEIKREVAKAFSDGYFYLDDEEGDATVEVTEVSLRDMTLISASEDEGEMVVDCDIEFTAEATYDDPDMTIFSEGERMSFGTKNATLYREESDNFTVIFQLDRVDKTLSSFSCSDTKSRAISLYSPDDYK